MIIGNTQVYGLENSIRISGYPMSCNNFILNKLTDKDYTRAEKLGRTPVGSGHNCYLKGIIVETDIAAPQYWWLQFQRYHFADIISSQSKMHKITKMNLIKQCNKYVDERIIKILQEKIDIYNLKKEIGNKKECQRAFQEVVSNVPSGLMLTAGIVTNYLQLKTMYQQRKNHKLEEWQFFCNWCEELPMFKKIVLKENIKKDNFQERLYEMYKQGRLDQQLESD